MSEIDFEQRRKQLELHPGFVAHAKWSGHYRIYRGVYRANRSKLLEHMYLPNTNDLLSTEMMQNVKPPIFREQYIDELLRLLLNYLASEFTLIDHARELISGYKDTEFKKKYDQQLKVIQESPEHHLIQDIRAIFLHQGIPPIRWTVIGRTDANKEFNLSLNVQRLLESKRLTKISKDYLKNIEGELDLTQLINEDGRLIDLFNSWLHLQFNELHAKDIEAFNKLQREYGFTPGPSIPKPE